MIHAVDPARGHLLHTDGIGLELIQQIPQHLGAEVKVDGGTVLGLHVEGHDLQGIVLHGLLHDGVGVGHGGAERLGLGGGGKEVQLGDVQRLAVLPCGLLKGQVEDLPVLGEGGQIQVDVLPVLGVGHAGGAGKALVVACVTDGLAAEVGKGTAPQAAVLHFQHQVRVLGGVGHDAVHGPHQVSQLEEGGGGGGANGGNARGGHADDLALGLVVHQGDVALGGAGEEGGGVHALHATHVDGGHEGRLGGFGGSLGGSLGGLLRGVVVRCFGGAVGHVVSRLGGRVGRRVGGSGGGHGLVPTVAGRQGQAQAQRQKQSSQQVIRAVAHRKFLLWEAYW